MKTLMSLTLKSTLLAVVLITWPLFSFGIEFPVDRLDQLPSVDHYDGQFRLADEIELGIGTLGHLADAFDYDKLKEDLFVIDQNGQWLYRSSGFLRVSPCLYLKCRSYFENKKGDYANISMPTKYC